MSEAIPKLSKTEVDAERYGIDLSLLERNLKLSYEQRLNEHETSLSLIEELLKARKQLHVESKRRS